VDRLDRRRAVRAAVYGAASVAAEMTALPKLIAIMMGIDRDTDGLPAVCVPQTNDVAVLINRDHPDIKAWLANPPGSNWIRRARRGDRCRRGDAPAAALMAVVILVLALAAPAGAAKAPQRPYSCRLYDDEQKKCAFGSSDKRVLERLERECLRDGGRP